MSDEASQDQQTKTDAPPDAIVARPLGVLIGRGFHDSLIRLIEAGHSRIVVDLGGVTAADYDALRGLSEAAAEIERKKGEIVLAGAVNTVDSLIRLTRVDHRIRLFDSVDQAAVALANR
ncbi:MAG: STAS domain-containing protein [Bryobacteraceae bacterium]